MKLEACNKNSPLAPLGGRVSKSENPPTASESPSDKTQKAEPEQEKPPDTGPVAEILAEWRKHPELVQPRQLNGDKKTIERALKRFSIDELRLAIGRYASVIADKTGRYWLSTRWTLAEFVSRKEGKWPASFTSDQWEQAVLSDSARKTENFWSGVRQAGEKASDHPPDDVPY